MGGREGKRRIKGSVGEELEREREQGREGERRAIRDEKERREE
jgi:hypothetical protein